MILGAGYTKMKEIQPDIKNFYKRATSHKFTTIDYEGKIQNCIVQNA